MRDLYTYNYKYLNKDLVDKYLAFDKYLELYKYPILGGNYLTGLNH